MNVIWPQAVCSDLHIVLEGIFEGEVEIELIVGRLEECRLTTVATLRDVMGNTRCNNTSDASHIPSLDVMTNQKKQQRTFQVEWPLLSTAMNWWGIKCGAPPDQLHGGLGGGIKRLEQALHPPIISPESGHLR